MAKMVIKKKNVKITEIIETLLSDCLKTVAIANYIVLFCIDLCVIT